MHGIQIAKEFLIRNRGRNVGRGKPQIGEYGKQYHKMSLRDERMVKEKLERRFVFK